MAPEQPAYLGDGVEVSFDGYHLVLTTDGGNNRIYLDPGVFSRLTEFAETVWERVTEGEIEQ